MKCEQNDCNEQATHIAYWPGQTIKQCYKHTKQVQNLGGVMGFHVDVVEIGEGNDTISSRNENSSKSD